MSLLLKPILKYSFTSSSTKGLLLRQSYAWFDVFCKKSTLILKGQLHSQHFDIVLEIVFQLFLEVHDNTKLPSDIFFSPLILILLHRSG